MSHANRLNLGLLSGIDEAVHNELLEAAEKFEPFNSAHEGYAVLLEEVDELWQEVKHGNDFHKLEAEAIQVAAMAIRFIHDSVYGGESQ
tara:strand:- start:1127 stop:1393 length:267 start_codon:yes stop_codon:yes gene_type:complete